MKLDELKIWYLVKNCRVKIDEDIIEATLKLNNYQIRIVKNIFHNKLYYAGFNVSENSIYYIEITKYYKDEYGNIKCSTIYSKTTEEALRKIENILYGRLSLYRKLIYRQIDNIIKIRLFIDGIKRAIFGYKVRNPLVVFRLAKNYMDMLIEYNKCR